MKQQLWIILVLFGFVSGYAQGTKLKGTILNADMSKPVSGAVVSLKKQNKLVYTNSKGEFVFEKAASGLDMMVISGLGILPTEVEVTVKLNQVTDLGIIKVKSFVEAINTDNAAFTFSESQLNENDDAAQTVSALLSPNDDVFLSKAGYAFSSMRFQVRGYDGQYTNNYINGIKFNDVESGRFSYGLIGGLNDATRNADEVNALAPSRFGFGSIGGSSNIDMRASHFAPGSKLSLSACNRNYTLRGMYTYSTGLMANGWAITASGSRRWANEGNIEGTFYNAWGYFLGVEKVFNDRHSVAFSTWGAPTQRAQQGASTQEAYDLAGSNYYNSNWGYQNGKKRNARVVEAFEPSAVLSWEYKINNKTKLNTAASFKYSNYGSTALNWYNAADPRPDYYRYLPSAFEGAQKEEATNLWINNVNTRQINWNKMYQANFLANAEGDGARYMVESRHNDQLAVGFSSVLNQSVSKSLTLTSGIELNTTKGMHYKTMDDLLGANFFVDRDQFAERDFGSASENLQNDLDNPNRKIYTGDKFGYNYNTYVNTGNLWTQGEYKQGHWDAYYAGKIGATQFWREGLMRNGRAKDNSKGNSEKSSFIEYAAKLGSTYKITGKHFINANIGFENRAPLVRNAFVSPRVKNTLISNLETEKILSGDISYIFNFSKIKGRLTAFQTNFYDQTEIDNYYHDQAKTYVNQVMTGINKTHRGFEAALAYRATSSLTFTAIASIAEYKYKNRPTATRSYENGSKADSTEVIYLKNFYVSGTPQTAASFAVDYAIKGWFFNANVNYYDRTYIDISPIRRTTGAVTGLGGSFGEELPTNEMINQKAQQIIEQEKLSSGFTLDLSIGKYLRFRNGTSLSLNLSVSNVLNNTNLKSGGYEQSRLDYITHSMDKFPNKYYYAQGTNAFLNIGYKF